MKDFEESGEGYGTLGVMFAFLGGAVAGAATALLLAPQSGARTRRQIIDLANTVGEKVAETPGKLREAGTAAKERITSRFATGNSTAKETRH